jgi:predicted transposase/invertase (TIGR01784 family)
MPYVTSWERIAKKEGKLEGKIEGKIEMAREFLKNGVSIDIVVKSTGFSRDEIEKLARAISS